MEKKRLGITVTYEREVISINQSISGAIFFPHENPYIWKFAQQMLRTFIELGIPVILSNV